MVPDMIGLVVSDLPRAIAFYRLLDLPFPDANGEDFVEVKVNGYRISLNSESLVKSIHGDWQQPRGQRHELAFKCESPAAVDQAYERITAAGYRGVEMPWDAFWGQRYAVVEDPDGIQVSLFAPLG